jgi:hypothetical protein
MQTAQFLTVSVDGRKSLLRNNKPRNQQIKNTMKNILCVCLVVAASLTAFAAGESVMRFRRIAQ